VRRAPRIGRVELLWGTVAVCGLLLLAGYINGPNPQAVQEYASGGLGLTRAQWTQHHTFVSGGPGGYLYDSLDQSPGTVYWIDFWTQQHPAPDDAVISSIRVDARYILTSTWKFSLDDAYHNFPVILAGVRTLLPADAQLESSRTVPTSDIRILETYHSPSLSTRYSSLEAH
jgi:hypothetical protein